MNGRTVTKYITDSTNEKFKELEDELKSIKNPIKKSPHKIQN